eukprot:Seg2253.8 transcript_id=Seg2253.8/GoldUCD/mRNA.D3Y31 product="Protein NATD1" protein_id=Seg2253.8/GoldUCD/D3Y31
MLQGLRWTKATWIARQSLAAVSRSSREIVRNTTENRATATTAKENRTFCTKMNGSIIHDEHNKMFYVELTNNGGKAVLEYEKTSVDVMDFYHTGVPTTHRGQGIAQNLVEAGLDYAFGNNIKVIPSCSYVLKYINENLKDAQMDKIIKD